ncbi:class I SAM-dependent methyltransferase [Chryseolinea sp. T2]|uniref:class I SAM-dependent methyltransferase n=1 Tax=Chryseolinea sp. T2 TaxID=3129255 RepID=UPI00307718E6
MSEARKVFRIISFMFLVIVMSTQLTNGQDQWTNIYRESAWKERDEWQRAPELIKQLRLKSGSTVADIGCHEGYMTVKLADVVKPSGRVYAVDVDAPKLELLNKHLAERGITNVTTVKGEYDDPKLPTDQLDGVIILDTYHEMSDYKKILIHIKAALKKGGRLVICEPIAESRRDLSRSEQATKHEISMKFVEEDLTIAGFTIVKKQDPFADRTTIKGDVMWMLVAEKK